MLQKCRLLVLILFVAALILFVVLRATGRSNTQMDAEQKENGSENPQAERISTRPFVDVEITSCLYPSELFFGDTCYCQVTRTNNTKEPFVVQDTLPVSQISIPGYQDTWFIISTEGIEEDYTIVPEVCMHRDNSWSTGEAYVRPGTSLPTSYPLELPPLEAMEHPFWEKLREKMTPEGIKCTLSIKLPERYVTNRRKYSRQMMSQIKYSPRYTVITHEFLIKPRPEKELALLDIWLRDTTKQFLPPLSRTLGEWDTQEWRDFEKNGYRQSGDNFVIINGQKYNPWCFIRDGNRKPPAPICPTTPEGWLELENSLVPSTMRDEIRFSRMLMDYFGAKGDVQVQKRDELVQWLKSLPEPQSMSMTSNLGDGSMQGTNAMTVLDFEPKLMAVFKKSHSEFMEKLSKRLQSYDGLLEELRPLMSYQHKQSESDRMKEYMKQAKEDQAK